MGGVLGAVIVMVMLSEPVSPPESVTEAVIEWEPTDRPLVENVLPEPIEPSMLEVQARLLLRLPSSVSVAVPLKVTDFPTK
jgi:hypothetical protein